MSTASFEYGFSACRAGPGASAVVRSRSATVSYRNAWWTRISCQRVVAMSVVGARREPAHELEDGGLDLAPEEQPAVAGQGVPDAIGQLADDPEVDVADRVARQDEQVGRVQVGVEVAEHIDLVEHVPVEVADDPVEVVAAGGKRLEVRAVPLALRDHDVDQRDADDQLRGQDARRRVVAVDPGDPLDLVTLRVLVEEDGLPRLDQVVQLVGGPARELVDHLPAPGGPEDVGPVEDPGHRVHQRDVFGERVADAGPLDLHRDRLAAVQDCAMDLADRGRRERLVAERLEDRLGVGAELLRDDHADVVVRERRDLVQQLEQLVAVGAPAAGRSAARASGRA